MITRSKILYAASTASHLRRFHMPYINALRKTHDVYLMATEGEEIDFPISFSKSFFSPSNLHSIFKIRAVLKKERFDRVIVHTTLAAFLIRAAMIGMRRRPYVLNVVHGYLFSRPIKGVRARILLICERLMRKKTDDLAVMNAEDYTIATEASLCRGNVFMMRGMGLPSLWRETGRDASLRASLGVSKEDFLCIFVGELSTRKNQQFLIRATALLRKSGLPIRLLLLGDGSERERLEQLVREEKLEDAVIFAGNCEPIHPYLGISDLYVSASVSEGLPFNIMEAMHAGLPIVASDTKGQSDLLSQYPNALYPLNDGDAFCNTVKNIYASKCYGEGSRAYPSLEQYRLETVFEENMKLFQKE